MGDLFGSDALFNDFDKQTHSPGEKDEIIDLSGSPESTTVSVQKVAEEKIEEIITFESKEIIFDRGAMKLPSDWPLVFSLASIGNTRPNYSSTFRDALCLPEPEEDKPQRPSRQRMSCFNCGGSHMLSNCKEPKDYAKIAQKRKEYNEANPQGPRQPPQNPPVQSPYSGSGVTGQIPPLLSFDHFKPGVISNVLRQALSLYPNQLPPYVYLLRELGYPPGWLEEARVPLPSEEVSDVPLFNPKRIVEYPGYNCPMPSGAVDETRHLRAKRFDQRHSVTAMRHWMEALKKHHEQRRLLVASKKSSEPQKPSHSTGVHGGEAAMDLDNNTDDEEAPTFTTTGASAGAQAEPPSVSNENSNSSIETADIESLEKEREQLLRLLESTLSGNACETTPSESETAEDEEYNPEEVSASSKSLSSVPSQEKQTTSFSLGVSTGTPLPEGVTYGNSGAVPDREKFASGIGCHLPFQNLPESVGTFQRLKRVLANVRKRQNGASGTSASVPSSPRQMDASSSVQKYSRGGRSSYQGYVDYDNPGSSSRNSNRRDRRSFDSYYSSSRDRGSYDPRPSSSTHRYRPY